MSYYDVMSREYDSPPGERRGRRRRRRGGLVIVILFLVVLGLFVGLVIGGVRVLDNLFSPPADYPGPGTGSVEVQITPGQSVRSIGNTLTEADVVASAQAFVDAARQNQDSESIQPGFYRLRAQMKASAALAALLDPDNRIGSKVTVQEGLRQSAALRELAESGDLKLAQLTAAAKDWRALGLPGYAHRRAEGFLFPATYDVEPDTTAAGLLAEMVAQFDQVATEINLENRAREVGLDPYQAVIVASLIQAEARHAEDFPKVARVIYNRLNQDMRLQLDSTVHYAVGKSGVVTTTAEDRASPSPYNTYRHEGLPPGPINSPGQAALEAALHPAKGAWLYFVTVNPDTGETKFATTAAQHAVNVQELREWLRDH
ncbi:MAG TPA: endolytic transglycosylase MltG [Actinomycetes bacterium]|nr:endolytic transglycosylase MltG [Actinomycetes bacterium]